MENEGLNKHFDIVKYVVPSSKLLSDEEKKVILIADLHDYTRYKKRSERLAQEIKDRNPDHIVIAGDNIQGAKWENIRAIGDFAYFIDNISEVAPVFISQGNHDLVGVNSRNYDIRIGNFRRLENIRLGSVFPLVNDRVVIDGFEIIGYTPRREIISKNCIQEHGIAHDMFIEEYEENGLKSENYKDKIVEFIGHNPFLIARSENKVGLESLSKVDTFYTGHVHNGYRHSSTISSNPDFYLDSGYVENIYSKDKDGKLILSSINPFYFKKTNLCRGVVYVDDNAQQKILQLSNNHFYINEETLDNKQKWTYLDADLAQSMIKNYRLHALVITGGIRKFFGFDMPGDLPEITEVTYKRVRRKK